MKATKPPLGVTPWWLWKELNPEPTVLDLFCRYRAVMAAVDRFRAAGREVKREWLSELGCGGRP